MPALNKASHEKFAQALARGASINDATTASGLKHNPKRMIARAATKKVKDRIAEIRQQDRWGAQDELAKVFTKLFNLASTAGSLRSGAGMAAAKDLLSEAVRLRERVPFAADAHAGPVDDPRLPTLTREEWIATFAKVGP